MERHDLHAIKGKEARYEREIGVREHARNPGGMAPQGIGVLRIVFGLVWAIDAWFKRNLCPSSSLGAVRLGRFSRVVVTLFPGWPSPADKRF